MFMLSLILDIKAIIDSEEGTLTLRFEHNKYWCEVEGYSKEKAETINNTLNGGIVMHFGEHINTISYYGNRVMLYIVGSLYVEVFYDPKQNKILQIQKLDPTHPRLALYTKDIDLNDLNLLL